MPKKLFNTFHDLITEEEKETPENIGKLRVFAGIKEFPNRVKCATLPWHTMMSALEDEKEVVSTE